MKSERHVPKSKQALWIDPDPLTIYLAIVSTIAGTATTANFIRTHVKPSAIKVRIRLLDELTGLEDEARYLRADLGKLRDIFTRARPINGSALRMASGAYLSQEDFRRFEEVSDSIYQRLRRTNKAALRVERAVSRYDRIEPTTATNYLSDAYAQIETLLDIRNLSADEGWSRLESALDDMTAAIREIRRQLESP